jgi:hypothetical protein
MDQIVQVAGALLILVAFVGAQFGWTRTSSPWYLALNLAGSLVLTWLAWEERQYGFLLLEAVWAAVSAWGLLQVMRDDEPMAAH